MFWMAMFVTILVFMVCGLVVLTGLVSQSHWSMTVNMKHNLYISIMQCLLCFFIVEGLDYGHPDVIDSFSQETSYDFNQRTPLQIPKHVGDNHGTRCAGQVVGKPNNSMCGVGLAFGARLSGPSMEII
jgi:hypothetical protein